MISIEVDPDLTLPGDLLEQAARATLDRTGALDADLSVVLTGNPRIQTLNRDFLGTDAPTDVLSFPADESDPETGRRYLGDVIISLPRALDQAAERGHTVEAEVQLLVVHGILHLLGYDHIKEEEKTCMWAAQSHVLERLGISPAIVHE